MSSSRLVACLALVALGSGGGCGGGGHATPTTPTRAKQRSLAAKAPTTIKMPHAFRYIPASTPYLVAADIDSSLIGNRLEILGLALREIYRDFKDQRSLLTGSEAAIGNALFDLFGEELSIESLARVGLPTVPRYYIYGIGLLPAIRMNLSSGKKLRSVIADVGRLAGARFPKPRLLAGQEYWYFPKLLGDNDSLSVAVAIVGDSLVAGLIVEALKDEMLPLLLGIRRPAKPLATSQQLQALLTRYNIQPSQLFLVDLVAIATQLLGADDRNLATRIARSLRAKQSSVLSPACSREVLSLVSLMPRIIGGTQSMTKHHSKGSLVIELHPDVIHALRSSRGEIPGGDLTTFRGPLAVGVGLDPEQLGVQAVSAARRIKNAPFACPALSELNQAANSMASLAVEPILKRIGSPTGFAAVFTTLNAKTSDFTGAFVATGRDVKTMWAMLANLVPVLHTLNVAADANPVRVPLPATTALGKPVFAALSDSLIGASLGAASDATLSRLMSAPMSTDGAISVMYYDLDLSDAKNETKLVDGVRQWGLTAAADRLAKLYALPRPTTRGDAIIRVSRAGLTMDWQIRAE